MTRPNEPRLELRWTRRYPAARRAGIGMSLRSDRVSSIGLFLVWELLAAVVVYVGSSSWGALSSPPLLFAAGALFGMLGAASLAFRTRTVLAVSASAAMVALTWFGFAALQGQAAGQAETVFATGLAALAFVWSSGRLFRQVTASTLQ